MSFTNRSNGPDRTGRHAAPENGAPTSVTAIPLTDVDVLGGASVGDLVKDATTHASTLVRAEVELAKTEIVGEIKKALQGSIFFLLALTVLLFSSFFFFFFAAELLNVWVSRWLAFLIVFLAMVVFAVLLALLGYLRVRKIRAPEKTINSLKEAKSVLPLPSDRPEIDGKHASGALSR